MALNASSTFVVTELVIINDNPTPVRERESIKFIIKLLTFLALIFWIAYRILNISDTNGCFRGFPLPIRFVLLFILFVLSALTLTSPSFISSVRSAMPLMDSISCVAIMTNVLSEIIFSNWKISFAFFSSKAPVGSSHKTTFGSFIMALAIATLCFSPPDILLILCFDNSFSPTSSKASSTLFFWINLLDLKDDSKGSKTLLNAVSKFNKLKFWNTYPIFWIL